MFYLPVNILGCLIYSLLINGDPVKFIQIKFINFTWMPVAVTLKPAVNEDFRGETIIKCRLSAVYSRNMNPVYKKIKCLVLNEG